MGKPLKALMVEDVDAETQLLVRALKRADYDVSFERVETAEAMAAALDRQTWDVVFSDFNLPRFGARAALSLVQARGLDLPFLIISGSVDETAVVEAIRAGAHDYMAKGHLARLVPALQRALAEAAQRTERARARAQLLVELEAAASGLAHVAGDAAARVLRLVAELRAEPPPPKSRP